MMRSTVAVVLVVLAVMTIGCGSTRGRDLTLATYNVENFARHFQAYALRDAAATQPADSLARRLVDDERRQNAEDQWEIASVITDPAFLPDVLMIQESCGQQDLEYFNRHWLNSAYETVIVFPGNSARGQHLGLMLRPGLRLIERRDQYYLEPDPVDPAQRLFARGAVFCLIETPEGTRLWVGNTHQKSRYKDTLADTRWRNREAVRTHQIMQDLRRSDAAGVVMLGDLNDAPGLQGYEAEAGADAVAALVGPEGSGLVLATAPLAARGEISFGGYHRDRHRSFIDHVVISEELRPLVRGVRVFRSPLAAVASDHYPVVLHLHIRAIR